MQFSYFSIFVPFFLWLNHVSGACFWSFWLCFWAELVSLDEGSFGFLLLLAKLCSWTLVFVFCSQRLCPWNWNYLFPGEINYELKWFFLVACFVYFNTDCHDYDNILCLLVCFLVVLLILQNLAVWGKHGNNSPISWSHVIERVWLKNIIEVLSNLQE